MQHWIWEQPYTCIQVSGAYVRQVCLQVYGVLEFDGLNNMVSTLLAAANLLCWGLTFFMHRLHGLWFISNQRMQLEMAGRLRKCV